jgi:hypothetical protein
MILELLINGTDKAGGTILYEEISTQFHTHPSTSVEEDK